MKKKLEAMVLTLVVTIMLLGCGGEEETYTVPNVVGKTVTDAKTALENAGFEDISTSVAEDAENKTMWDGNNWTVMSQSPEAKSEETKDVSIELVIKKTSEIEQEKADVEKEELSAVINMTFTDAQNKLNELGYTATYVHQTSGLDMTEDLSVLPADELAKWVVTDLKSFDSEAKTAQLEVNTSENISANEAQQATEEALEAKLPATYAWQAVSDYGEIQYPYGFKLHSIMGVLAEEAQDENTWYLKATCTITNEYNAEYEAECEAVVTGTKDSPTVTSFAVY